MNEFSWLAKILIGAGLLFLFVGIIFLFLDKIGGIGKLPGDIFIKKENFTFYFPLGLSLLLSLLLTFLINIFFRR